MLYTYTIFPDAQGYDLQTSSLHGNGTSTLSCSLGSLSCPLGSLSCPLGSLSCPLGFSS